MEHPTLPPKSMRLRVRRCPPLRDNPIVTEHQRDGGADWFVEDSSHDFFIGSFDID